MSLPEPRAVGHESDAMRLRWVGYGLITLVLLGIFTGLAMRSLLNFWKRQPRPVDAPRSAVEHVAPERDGPPLQPSLDHDFAPTRDLASMRAAEGRVFASIGWTLDQATGLPRVPASVVASVAARTATRPATATTQEAAR